MIHRRASVEVGRPAFQHVVRSARGGGQVNPWLGVLNQQAMLMAALGDRVGFNPKARGWQDAAGAGAADHGFFMAAPVRHDRGKTPDQHSYWNWRLNITK